ncbi:hypothetical protein [Sphingomonas pokkalii]|uniref:hypothetical protein n=1 Tax=Sphingomonas pokkalii TaxID=2175090 RepID=UPI0010581DCF|nr:hypothetical protein [Sphingomonas pokkalii]
MAAPAQVAVIRIGRHKSGMRVANWTLLGLCLCASTAGCDAYLRLEILNATDENMNVVVEGRDARVEPGLSYSGQYPASGSTITIRTAKCSRDYVTPNLDQSPWKVFDWAVGQIESSFIWRTYRLCTDA